MRFSKDAFVLAFSIASIPKCVNSLGCNVRNRISKPSAITFSSHLFTDGYEIGSTSRLFSSTSESTDHQNDVDPKEKKRPTYTSSPWSSESLALNSKRGGGINKSRFRQHVNPLASKFQMPTELNNDWPNDGSYLNPSLPLHVDIGCGKGGFLLDLCSKQLSKNLDEDEKQNYLGLEIRPSVAQYAKERVAKWNLKGSLDFIGCNANVDLDRILGKYVTASKPKAEEGDVAAGEITMVSIQFPDPHFKKQHQKRRVVTPELVKILAKYLPPEKGTVFIQSDVKVVLDSMRETIRESGSEYFEDALESVDDYLEENPIGVQTEREKSVLDQNLPVYRTIFRRTNVQLKE